MQYINQLTLVDATADMVGEGAAWIESQADRLGISPATAQQLAACALEALNNSIEHAYDMRGGDVRLDLVSDDHAVTITIRDHGTGLQSEAPQPTGCPLSERGRGYWVMSRWCDSVKHEFHDGHQLVILTKLRRSGP
jgi:anti-sigma regulatory factor (Ser/Thr protein kinase)